MEESLANYLVNLNKRPMFPSDPKDEEGYRIVPTIQGGYSNGTTGSGRVMNRADGSANIMSGAPLATNGLVGLQFRGNRRAGSEDIENTQASIGTNLGPTSFYVGTDNSGSLNRSVGVNLPTKTNIQVGDTQGRYYNGMNANIYQQLGDGGFGGWYSEGVSNGQRNSNHGLFANAQLTPTTSLDVNADSDGRGGYIPAALLTYRSKF